MTAFLRKPSGHSWWNINTLPCFYHFLFHSLRFLLIQSSVFVDVVPVFTCFPPPLSLFERLNVQSWWDCWSRSTVRSNCRVVLGRETGLLGEEVQENIMSPHSFLSSFCFTFLLSPALPHILLSPSDSLHDYTEYDDHPAWLIKWQGEMERHKRVWKEREDVDRAAPRLLKHRLPRCSPSVCRLHQSPQMPVEGQRELPNELGGERDQWRKD